MSNLQNLSNLIDSEIEFRYLNAGGIITAIPVNNIKQEAGEYTFLVNRRPEFSWVRTVDLHDTAEKASFYNPAQFLQ